MKQGKNRDHPPRMAVKAKRAESDRAEKFSAVWRDNLFSKRRNSPDGSNFAFVRMTVWLIASADDGARR